MARTVLLVLPVFNESGILYENTEKIMAHVKKMQGYDVRILIVDNGSTDSTAEVATRLGQRAPERVSYRFLKKRGRGNALREAWLSASEDIICSMDIDLSTSLECFEDMLEGIREGNNLCIGSRYLPGSDVERSAHRLILSRMYNTLIRRLFRSAVTDFQCGFKAADRRSLGPILSSAINDEWFFDTELVLRASDRGLRIKEIPVKWRENPQSSVNLVRDILGYFRAIRKHMSTCSR